jgi:flagellar motor switch protein FliN/FliY
MITDANEIELEPLTELATAGQPLVASALPFLGAVNVRVDVRVGSAPIDLASLLAMQHGAVLALDRLLEQPVDVRVGDHVVARGMLVAVDDHFGVRITETAALAGAHNDLAP